MLELESPTYDIKKQMLFNKLHITLLKFRSDWILHLKVSEFGFYPTRIKTRYPEITKIPYIYIYPYNLTLNP